MWNLINNNLKIFIDPFTFIGLKNLDQRVLLINTLQDYFKKIEPNLCDVNFFYPQYAEDIFGMRRTFLRNDKVIMIERAPETIISVFPIHPEVGPTELGQAGKMLNEFFSTAIQNKCVFYLSESKFNEEKKKDIEKVYGIQIVDIKELYQKIESYLQGFYNYFKFCSASIGIEGIESPDIAHAMSDEFYSNTLIPFESEINKNQLSEELKERMRSFVHNRYVDILITIDQINFFKLQQRIYDIEHNIVDNKWPHFHGPIRYYFNYYLFLLWGAIDHLAWIINDIFNFEYSPDNLNDRRIVGLFKSKQDFLNKIKTADAELYNLVSADDFQEWLFFFSQLRHKNAHREMFSASPLLITTKDSEISDAEIDAIIYKDEPPIPKEIEHMMPPKFIENQKIINRRYYRISKMKKGIEHFALIKKDGKQYMFNPISRIPIDVKNLRDLALKIYEAYKKANNPRQKN